MTKANSGFTVDAHFEKKDTVVRSIYSRILEKALAFGVVVEDPKKTSIHLNNKTAFAGIATRKSAIILTIKSDRRLSSPRIHKSEQTSASRFHHEVRLGSPADVDAELTRWLKAAYELSS